MTWEGHGSSSGPLIAKGKVIQGMGGCTAYILEKCFISAYDAATGKQLWKFTRSPKNGEPGGDTWGTLTTPVPRRRRNLDHRQLRSRSESDLLGNRAGQAVDAGQPRHDNAATRRSTRVPRSRSMSIPASWPGTSSTLPAKRWTSTSSSSACWSIPADRIWCSRPARTASSGSSIARPASTSATRKRSSRTSGATSIRKPASRTIAQDIIEHEVGEWIEGCPSTEGGHNWQAMSHHKPTNQLIIPLSQSCIAIRAPGMSDLRGRRRRQRRRRGPAFLRDAGHRRQHRQARRLRREHAEGNVVAAAARAVPDRRSYRRPAAWPSSAISTARSRQSM